MLGWFTAELGFDKFVFWPGDDPFSQAERFAEEAVPGLRAAVAHR